MIIMVVVIIMVVMVITMRMNDTIEVFRLSIHHGGSKGCFDGKCAVVGQAPFKDKTKLAINSVVLWLAIQVGLKTTMTFDRDNGSGTKFAGRELFSTTMPTVGMNPTDSSIATHQQHECGSRVQKRKT